MSVWREICQYLFISWKCKVDTCGTAQFCDMTLTATVRRAAICSPPHPPVKKILVHYNSDKTSQNLIDKECQHIKISWNWEHRNDRNIAYICWKVIHKRYKLQLWLQTHIWGKKPKHTWNIRGPLWSRLWYVHKYSKKNEYFPYYI